MKIAVNTRLLLKNKLEGIGVFTYEIFKRITKNHPEHQFFFIFDRPCDKSYVFEENVTPIVVGPPARHPFLFYWWFEKSIPQILEKHKIDVFFSPDGYLSLATAIRSITVIHDLNFEHYPKQIPFWARKHYRYFFPKFAQKASDIITVSEFSKKDIHEKYKIDNSKIKVVYNGISAYFKPIKRAKKEKIRAQYTQGNPYFIHVGSINPRKNIANLFLAFDQFIKQSKKDIYLLVVGEKMWKDSNLDAVFNGLKNKNKIIFTGRLSNEGLGEVLASAMALTYVSLFEGFGIPIIEAMKCNVPVITSNASSMPEIAGEGAFLVEPNNVGSIVEAMEKIQDETVQNKLIALGEKQCKKYSWDKAAKEVWEVIASNNTK